MKDITKDADWYKLGWESHAEYVRRKNRVAFWNWTLVVVVSLIIITVLLVVFTPTN